MPQAATIEVRLTQEHLDFVNSLIATGQYGSADEVFAHAVQAIKDRDEVRELWLNEIAVPAYDNYLADPSRAIPFDEVALELTDDFQHSHSSR